MAINTSEFINKVDIGLKANKEFTRFYARFKLEGKVVQRVFNFIDKNWDKRTRVSKAKISLHELKESEQTLSDSITLDKISELYFDSREASNWTTELKKIYTIHIKKPLGKKKTKDIKRLHLDKLISELRKSGKSPQNTNGCSPRTIKKIIVECLKPILQYAVDNDVLNKLPKFPEIKLNREKKRVEDALNKLTLLFKTINQLYEDDPFYRALFLFALYGRRWNEIRTIEWKDIDLANNSYVIRAENNKINIDQFYDLPKPIKKVLELQMSDKNELVFKSPITCRELSSPKTQIAKIRKESNIPELTMHYFRHIFVSAISTSEHISSTMLSASLGHTSLETVNKHYLSVDHQKSSENVNQVVDTILLGENNAK
ncbi:tyrosine-type recombinase/integrase [Poseidonibacter ostreae]|uniref:tyrosine-type recombinase/integrase n=1 Tax=Poseidonibacter ostreae TaxID=2654171 RepID=UPI00126417D9|nr:tyrosine-type recombinase/integrase [Poseidonibacter ostreae]KAB7887676.1 tyrosine-type recombinase/integrase [Poseidonibacter ostreae]